MPFQAPFNDQYQPGDLIYGLGNPRKKLYQRFGLNARTIASTSLAVVNNYLITADEQNKEASILQFSGFDDTQKSEHLNQINQLRGYLSSHAKYNTAVGWSGANLKGAARDNAENSAWRRKCKGGIEYICFQTVHHIHFCLDGLDFLAVANKNFAPSGGGQADFKNTDIDKYRAVTNAELRWIYRNQNDVRVQARIQFWKTGANGFTTCPPPWVTAPSDWSSYTPKKWLTS